MQRVVPCHFLLLLVLALSPLLGCSKTPIPQATSEKPGVFVVGVSLASLDTPWRLQMKADIEAAAAKHPSLRLIVRNAKNDAARQRTQIEEFLTDRVNALIVSPKDPQTLAAPVAKAFDTGLPVIVLDRAVIGGKYSCFIAANPKQIGATAGRWLAEKLHGKGKIVQLNGPVDSLWAMDLQAAFEAVLRDPGYRFVFEGFLDPPKIGGAELMKEALDRVEKIDAVFAYNDAAAHAAYQTAKTAGREKDVLFLGVGGLPDVGRAYVSQGALSASFLLPTGGAEAIEAVEKLLHGKKAPQTIVLATRVFTEKDTE